MHFVFPAFTCKVGQGIRRIEIMEKQCLECGKTFYKPNNRSVNSWNKKAKYCSRDCRVMAMKDIMLGRNITWGKKISKAKMGHTVSKEARIKIGLAGIGRPNIFKGKKRPEMTGINSPVWKGGKPKCKRCGKQLSAYVKKLCWDCHIKLPKKEKRNKSWKGGITYSYGYKYILMPEHQNSNKRGYIAEHRLVASNIIGRPLKKYEAVHHINEIKDDNRPENLYLFTKREHDKFHKKPYNLISNL